MRLLPHEGEVSEAVPDRHSSEARVSLGVQELDQMLDGGLMPHRPYLIVGPSGTGKTTLALQFLCEGVRRGERSLYVTLEDPPNEVRWNHRALRPDLDSVDVFDAIPDVMRYERAPFKDIAAVRQIVAFGEIPATIRQTPELTSVEVTGTALEQLLRSEVQKHGYARLVIDSLTALQYFCMKGFDPIVGAQTFLRFLTDLRTTTLLTIEAPLEDVETPERMLARGEIRLFRWELDGATVRAVGVEKFRGSSHDVRLHPYRIGAKGIDVQLAQTISRDTRRIVEPELAVALRGEGPPFPTATTEAVVRPPPVAAATASEPLSQQIHDLVTLGVDVSPLRSEVEAALDAIRSSRRAEATARLARISAMAISLVPLESVRLAPTGRVEGSTVKAYHRVAARADRSREGGPPTELPPSSVLARELGTILAMVPPRTAVAGKAPEPAGPSAGRAPARSRAAAPVEAKAPTTPPAPPGAEAGAPPAAHEVPVPEPEVVPPPSTAVRPARPARTAPRRATRAAAVPPLPEPPPLPKVARLPFPGAAVPSPTPGSPAAPALAEPPSSAAPAPPTATAAAPRRRRRAPAPKAAPTAPSLEAGAEASGPTPPPATKPRKRTVRRKKAPRVVAAEVELPPSEVAPAPAPPSAAPEESVPREAP